MPELRQRTSEETLAIWEAEDGRCEACGRPMDHRIAQIVFRDGVLPDEQQAALICPLCAHGLGSPFDTARVDKITAEILAAGLKVDKAAAAQWLRENLETGGVLITASRDSLVVWIPGLGTIKVVRRPDKLPLMTVLKWHAAAPWIVKFMAQAHTRGLPRLSVAYEGAWGAITDTGHPGPYWQARSLRTKPTEPPGSTQHTQGGTIVAEIAIRSAKIAITIPRDQWPDKLMGTSTAEFVALHIVTPEGLKLKATVKAKSFRKAQKILQTIDSEKAMATIIMQGRLMPGFMLADAGIVVQRKSPTPPA